MKIHLVQNKSLALSLKHVFGLIAHEAKSKSTKKRKNLQEFTRLAA
jgi:hypothetical protein